MLTPRILKLFFLWVFICCCEISFAQQWENTYGDGGRQRGFKMIETYDAGVAILGQTGSIGNERILLVKTDINGNLLWDKTIGSTSYYSYAYSIDVTNDGGFILSGSTSQYDSMGTAFVLKLNECGEKQWCKIYGLPSHYETAYAVYQLQNSDYIILALGFGPTSSTSYRIGLMKLDTAGNILWLNDYTHYNNLSVNGNPLILNSDNGFLITGFCYVQNPSGDTSIYWARTMVIKVDSAGNEQWNVPYGVSDYFYSFGDASRETSDGGYLTLGTHINFSNNHYYPYLFKADANGNLQWKTLLGDTTKRYGGLDILAMNDSVSITLSYATDTFSSNNYYLKILKIDTAGTVLDSISYGYCNFAEVFSKLSKTRDGKILVASTKYLGGSNHDIYVLKLNTNLLLDTMYNISLNYDSLCSSGITTGFISLDTMSWVGVEDASAPLSMTMLVYPNPASSEFKVESSKFKVEGIELYDVVRQRVFSQQLTANSHQPISINISFLPNGIYFLRVKSREKSFSQKIIISR